MTLRTLAAAACISLATATTAISAPITLDFAFDDVTGTFYGLDDNDGTSSATSLDLSFEGSTWTGLSIGGGFFLENVFEFSAGKLARGDFEWTNVYAGADVGSIAIENLLVEGPLGILDLVEFPSGDPSFVAGPVNYVINPVSAVPLPAGGLLLLSAFGGVAALKRRKKRAA